MTEIHDIKIYESINLELQPEFNDKKMFKGQFILEKDGWFEGIVKDAGIRLHLEDIWHEKIVIDKSIPFDFERALEYIGNDTGVKPFPLHYFIFGVYLTDKHMELFMVGPDHIDIHGNYVGEKEKDYYSGPMICVSKYGSTSDSLCRIIPTINENEDTQELQMRINECKQNMGDCENRKYYEYNLKNRSKLIECYNAISDKTLSEEEKDKIARAILGLPDAEVEIEKRKNKIQ